MRVHASALVVVVEEPAQIHSKQNPGRQRKVFVWKILNVKPALSVLENTTPENAERIQFSETPD